jgi:acylphosphatase
MTLSARTGTIAAVVLKSARHYFVSGQVQGVGYRYFARHAARELDLAGWVRNLADGRVEVYAAGDARNLDALEDRLRAGPSHAQVRAVEASEAPVDAKLEGFHIR